MRLSKKCQYALRAVFGLSVQNHSKPIKIGQLADTQDIPPRFLEVILNDLRHSSLVESKRGNDGGYMLAKASDKITIGEVINCIEGPIGLNMEKSKIAGIECFGDYAFEELWTNINNSIANICNNTTFADLVEQEKTKKKAVASNYSI